MTDPRESSEAPDPAPSSSSRRRFIQQSAALAGGAALLGSSMARGHPRHTTPSVKRRTVTPPKSDEPIRIGVIGTGGMGTGHVNAFLSFAGEGRADVQIVALAEVCDPRIKGAQKACDEAQSFEVDTYRDYRELLARDDIHAVLIASPEHWHAQHAIDALAAGKDVYVEKPMTLRLDEALDLRRHVLARPDQIFQVGTQMMMLPKYRKAREVIKQGRIGTPLWSQTSYCRNTPDGEWNYYGIDSSWKPGENLDWDGWLGHLGPREWDPKVYARWRRYKDFSTGIVGDLLVHVMTPLVLAIDQGWPVEVSAVGGHYVDKAMENHDQVNLTARFANGHSLVVAGATNNESGLKTMIRGNEANIYLGGRHCDIRPERPYADIRSPETIRCEDIGNDQNQLRLNWLESIRSREPAASGIELATQVMVIVDLATRAMWKGHAYRFDPETMQAKAV